MNLLSFVSCWGNQADIATALTLANEWQADGIEGPAPADPMNREALRLRALPWIAEIATGGGYVPRPGLSVDGHLADLRRLVDESLPYGPVMFNVLAGSDAWTFTQKVDFYTSALALQEEAGVPFAFETHRSRPTFTPWVTRDLLLELPDLRVTCDFSHWCVVTERLVMEAEPELLQLMAERARHVHARVGYDQGPQVPDPRAPEHEASVAAHLRWWRALLEARAALGEATFFFTPEFGPDGYLQCAPFSREPAADLREVNRWMLGRFRDVMAGLQSSYDSV